MHFAYRCLDPKNGRIYLAKHVKFHSKVFPYFSASSSIQDNNSSKSPPWLTMTYDSTLHQDLASTSGKTSIHNLPISSFFNPTSSLSRSIIQSEMPQPAISPSPPPSPILS